MKRSTPSPEIQEMAGCVCFALRKASRAVTQFYDRAVKAHGLRGTQISILVAAAETNVAPLAKLAKVLGMDRTTLLRNVRPLVRRRLLVVAPAPDSPRTEVRATAEGRALLRRIYPDWRKAQDRVLKSLQGLDWTRSLEAFSEGVRSTR